MTRPYYIKRKTGKSDVYHLYLDCSRVRYSKGKKYAYTESVSAKRHVCYDCAVRKRKELKADEKA